ncbi:MAG: TonB-dependent receptor [Opitutales bacterium]|nr:TonB-dependent receptor [Opitutales bacterium]
MKLIFKDAAVPYPRITAFAALLAVSFPALHAQADDDDVYILDPFVVDTAGDRGYYASNAVSGTRINMLIQELPQSLLVITEELLEDVAATDLYSALEYAGGVVQGSDRDTPSQVIVRGFATDWPLRNGIKRVGAVVDAANISRLEVVKGPAAILYGQSGLGGVVNYITKTPTSGDTFGSIKATVGSYNHFRLEADLNVPLTDDNKWLSRFTGAVQSSESFIQDFKNDIYFFAPALEWRPTSEISLRLDGELYIQNQTAPVSALPRYNHPERVNQASSYNRARGLDGLIPVDRSYNLNPPDSFRDFDMKTITSDFRWTPSDGLGPLDRFSYRNVLYFHDVERDQHAALVGAIDRMHRIAPGLLPASRLFLGSELVFTDTAIWSPVIRHARNEVYTVQNEFSLGKEFDRTSIQVLIGQEYFRDERTDRWRRLGGSAGDRATDILTLSRVPIFAPTLDGASFPSQLVDGANAAQFQELYPEYPLTPEAFAGNLYTVREYNRLEFSEEINVVKAYYLSSQIEMFNGRVTAMLGLRHDQFDNRNRQSSRNVPVNPEDRIGYDYEDPQFTTEFEFFRTRNTSPQLGASYKINDDLNLYALYSEGVFPNNNLNLREGVELKPQTSEGFDLGLKYQLWDRRINGTVAVFQIERANLPRPVSDPDTGQTFQELGGIHRSRGFEIDFVLAPTENWQFFGGYTYLDAKYTEDTDPRNDGTRLAYVPDHRFSILGKYLFREGALEGFHAGVGFVYQSDTRGVDTPGQENVDFVISGYVKWDLIAGYRTQVWGRDITFNAKLENVFDRTYIPNRLQGYGRPRSLIVNMKVEF